MLQEAMTNKVEYQKLSPEEQKNRRILGRLVGPLADFKHPTRNQRFYTEELWDKVFNNPIMQEKLRTKTLFGELGHPLDDRTEVDMEKIAICLAEEPKKYPDGTVRGIFDIIDTPNGRILKTLCDYGCQIGVSSRGTGDIVEDWTTGGETVNPDTYRCECWDAVLLPAVESARLSIVNESLGQRTLKKSLTEMIHNASPEAKKVMMETLERLNIDYSSSKENNIEAEAEKVSAAEDVGAEMIKSLQESFKKEQQYQEQIKSLQESVSVCNAKVAKLEEENLNYKLKLNSVENLTKLNESLSEQLTQKTELASKQARQLDILLKRLAGEKVDKKKLTESLASVQKTQEDNQKLISEQATSLKEIETLNESLESLKKDSSLIKQEYQKKLQKERALTEHYKQIAVTASRKYIEAKAKMIGVKPSDIQNKLNEGYSFNDIDRVCEDLQAYQLRVGSLPFNISSGDKVKVSIRESKEPIKPSNRFDDIVDNDLLKWAAK